jgi:hypothetical protein
MGVPQYTARPSATRRLEGQGSAQLAPSARGSGTGKETADGACCSWPRKTSPPLYPRSYQAARSAPSSRRGLPQAASFQPNRIAVRRRCANVRSTVTVGNGSATPAKECHDTGLLRRDHHKCGDRQECKEMKCYPSVHIFPLRESQKWPSRLNDPAGFAIHSTRRMSEPVLVAPGFTVSEAGSECPPWRATRHELPSCGAAVPRHSLCRRRLTRLATGSRPRRDGR